MSANDIPEPIATYLKQLRGEDESARAVSYEPRERVIVIAPQKPGQEDRDSIMLAYSEQQAQPVVQAYFNTNAATVVDGFIYLPVEALKAKVGSGKANEAIDELNKLVVDVYLGDEAALENLENIKHRNEEVNAVNAQEAGKAAASAAVIKSRSDAIRDLLGLEVKATGGPDPENVKYECAAGVWAMAGILEGLPKIIRDLKTPVMVEEMSGSVLARNLFKPQEKQQAYINVVPATGEPKGFEITAKMAEFIERNLPQMLTIKQGLRLNTTLGATSSLTIAGMGQGL